MKTFLRTQGQMRRRAIIAVLTAFLLVPVAGMLAFSVDVGYLLKKRAELQRAADAAALAAVVDIVPDALGNQDFAKARNTVATFAAANVNDVSNFQVLSTDISFGRFDPATVYTNFTMLNNGVADTVRVTLRRDSKANSPLSLLFARIFGILDSEITVTSTAVLQKARTVPPGVGILPFSIPKDVWDTKTQTDPAWSIYGDGKLADEFGNSIPGNWGTLDIGSTSNSTRDISDQILQGLRQEDLDALHLDTRIPQAEYIDSVVPMNANGDTGLSGGMKHALEQVIGIPKLIPVYDGSTGHGGNLEFHIVGWGVVYIEDLKLQGNKKSYLKIKKTYTYEGLLRPNRDLTETSAIIDGAFTSPALVQ